MRSCRILLLSCLSICSAAFAADSSLIGSLFAFASSKTHQHDTAKPNLLAAFDDLVFALNRPLTQAIKSNNSETVFELAESGPAISGQHLLLAIAMSINRQEETGLSDDGRVVQILIDHKAPLDSRAEEQGLTALMLAASVNRVDLVAKLCEGGAIPDLIDKEGGTALHWATSCGADCAADWLLKKGNALANTYDHSNHTPLHLAIIKDRPKILEALVSHADLNLQRLIRRMSPLLLAFRSKSEQAALVLIKHKIGIETVGTEGKTPLHETAEQGFLEALRALLPLVSCDAQDQHLRTPLFLALLKKQIEAANILIDAGVDLSLKNHMGNTPLHIAARDGLVDTVRKLIAQGANPDAQDNNGKRPQDFTQNAAILEMLVVKEIPASSCVFLPEGEPLSQVESPEAVLSVEESSYSPSNSRSSECSESSCTETASGSEGGEESSYSPSDSRSSECSESSYTETASGSEGDEESSEGESDEQESPTIYDFNNQESPALFGYSQLF